MIDAEDLKKDLMTWFEGFPCEVHDGLDFEEFREADNVLAIVVSSIKEANVGLPDYFVDVQFILDCRIQQDDSTKVYETLTTELMRKLQALTFRGEDIKAKFERAPVVGIHQAAEVRRSINGDSNMTTATLHFALSYDL